MQEVPVRERHQAAPPGERPSPNDRDVRLVERLAAGDRAALQELYHQYAPMLLLMARRILGDREAAEEVVQESLLQVWRQSDRYDPGRGTVSTWLGLVARSRALDRFRSRRSRQRARAAWASGERNAEGEAVEQSKAYGAVLHRERRVRLRHALGRIPDPQRRVLELAYYDGLSQRDIAERLSIPLGTVKTRSYLGMKKLRRKLSPDLL